MEAPLQESEARARDDLDFFLAAWHAMLCLLRAPGLHLRGAEKRLLRDALPLAERFRRESEAYVDVRAFAGQHAAELDALCERLYEVLERRRKRDVTLWAAPSSYTEADEDFDSLLPSGDARARTSVRVIAQLGITSEEAEAIEAAGRRLEEFDPRKFSEAELEWGRQVAKLRAASHEEGARKA